MANAAGSLTPFFLPRLFGAAARGFFGAAGLRAPDAARRRFGVASGAAASAGVVSGCAFRAADRLGVDDRRASPPRARPPRPRRSTGASASITGGSACAAASVPGTGSAMARLLDRRHRRRPLERGAGEHAEHALPVAFEAQQRVALGGPQQVEDPAEAVAPLVEARLRPPGATASRSSRTSASAADPATARALAAASTSASFCWAASASTAAPARTAGAAAGASAGLPASAGCRPPGSTADVPLDGRLRRGRRGPRPRSCGWRSLGCRSPAAGPLGAFLCPARVEILHLDQQVAARLVQADEAGLRELLGEVPERSGAVVLLREGGIELEQRALEEAELRRDLALGQHLQRPPDQRERRADRLRARRRARAPDAAWRRRRR